MAFVHRALKYFYSLDYFNETCTKAIVKKVRTSIFCTPPQCYFLAQFFFRKRIKKIASSVRKQKQYTVGPRLSELPLSKRRHAVPNVLLSERSCEILLSFVDIYYIANMARIRTRSSSDRPLRRCSACTSVERSVFASPARRAFL